MRSIVDHTHALDSGLARIRKQFDVPTEFPPKVLEHAAEAARRQPGEHIDRTSWPFVTLDPATSTDLDQAFTIERSGDDLLLHYAIADVGWFVDDGDVIDVEAWKRGTTIYLPDGRAALYPPVISEGAASMLPDGPRPAVVFHVRLSSAGVASLDGAERSIVHSRAKLAYDSVKSSDLPDGFDEFARRVTEAAAARGAAPVSSPEQAVERDDGRYRLQFRPILASERKNSALSLATNLAVAEVMLAAGVGLFRVMAGPDGRAVRRLRHTAGAFGLAWPRDETLDSFSRRLDINRPADAAFAIAVRRAGGGADYVPFTQGVTPWHSAMAATYAHATAPLRRLADRYVVATVLALANGRDVPDVVRSALDELPATMERAQGVAGQVERAVVDLAEAVTMHGREGEIFQAVAVDDEEAISRIQLCNVPVVAKVKARGVRPGDEMRVKLVAVDLDSRTVEFQRVS